MRLVVFFLLISNFCYSQACDYSPIRIFISGNAAYIQDGSRCLNYDLKTLKWQQTNNRKYRPWTDIPDSGNYRLSLDKVTKRWIRVYMECEDCVVRCFPKKAIPQCDNGFKLAKAVYKVGAVTNCAYSPDHGWNHPKWEVSQDGETWEPWENTGFNPWYIHSLHHKELFPGYFRATHECNGCVEMSNIIYSKGTRYE